MNNSFFFYLLNLIISKSKLMLASVIFCEKTLAVLAVLLAALRTESRVQVV